MPRLFQISLFSICCCILFLFVAERWYTQTLIQPQEVQSYLEKSLDHDTTLLINADYSQGFEKVNSELENAMYSIVIYQKDSIVYWNKNATHSDNFNTLPIKSIPLSNNHTGDISFYTKTFNISDFAQKHKVALTTDTVGLSTLTFYNTTYGLDFSKKINIKFFKKFIWALSISLFLVILLYFKKDFDTHHKGGSISINTWLYPFLAITIFYGLHFIKPFKSYFDNLSVFALLHKDISWLPNISALIFGILSLWYLCYLSTEYLKNIKVNPRHRNFLTLGVGAVTYGLFGLAVYLISYLVSSPVIILDIDTLMSLKIESFIVICCLCLLMLILFFVSNVLFKVLLHNKASGINKLTYHFIGWSLAFIFLYFLNLWKVPIFIFTFFILSFTLILDAYVEKVEKRVTYIIWWMIMFSGFLAANIYYFSLKKDKVERIAFLNNYYHASNNKVVDTLIEIQDSLLSKAVFNKIASLEPSAKIDKEDLIEFMFSSLPYKSVLANIDIELFDKNTSNTLFSNHFADFFTINELFENSRVIGRQVRHHPFTNTYITRFEIARVQPQNASWYLYIKYIESDKKAVSRTKNKYAFAVFKNENLIIKEDEKQAFPDVAVLATCPVDFKMPGYDIEIYQPHKTYRLVSWKKTSGLIKPISLFSFLFTLLSIIWILLSVVNNYFKILPESLAFGVGTLSSLKTKIQIAIILLTISSFLIIGVITGFYFKNLIEADQVRTQNKETLTLYNSVKGQIQNMVDDPYAYSFLKSNLKTLSLIHDKTLSLYDVNGRIITTTDESNEKIRIPFYIYSKHTDLSSEKMFSPIIVWQDNLTYLAFHLNEAKPFGYISLQHKNVTSSSSNIIEFLSTILNAYIFLFLLAGGIAITIANSITKPLTSLAEKLKKFKLGKRNELLEWTTNDEIGTLIKDYNNLTHQLENSAALLAKTERDMAWREMAKQVAHEIKNPLTPMKLSIQHLERTAKDDPTRAVDLIPRISNTLVEQIDNLSQIAGEFSNFATLPQANNEKIILNEIVEVIHDLFRKREDMDISMIEPIDDLIVFADKNHLVRILNNLLKNAIQAIPDNRRGKIELELKRSGKDAIVRISDNGIGIPEHMKDKVFTPNFTTKSSGTGLGLAISVNMIESFNGRIYFETKEQIGTDFYVAIPLMRLEDNIGSEDRVVLD